MDLIQKYFPLLNSTQEKQFGKLLEVIPGLNQQVNIISRKDIEHLEEKHILHSLAIAMKFTFAPGQSVIDAGTGGGFPGIPLAILFPETRFILVDSIGKKINLVNEVSEALELKNVRALHQRAESLESRADFVVSRAVTAFPKLYEWTWRLIKPARAEQRNGMIALKGGDLDTELSLFRNRVQLFPVSEWFEESFFSTKTIVYLNK
ncbi:MAG: 16S rRNA (guanine(527)-N(7))-methyltransferase RsmG [Bacteroidetes bacterium]|nr:16S rRNA (guanine(527)-N(7))-methyltransferase RsmG [Bacteroidota bacterium]